MKKIHDTIALCDICYRHIPAVAFERDGSIFLEKTCKHHGRMEHLTEPDAQFYFDFKYDLDYVPNSYAVEVTNRCNLECPHCYQTPDNKSIDPPIGLIIEKVLSWPDDGYRTTIVGAESTTRKDLPELMRALRALPRKHRQYVIASNCVNLSRLEYAKQFKDIDDIVWIIGLNLANYIGPKIRAKQMKGIKNAIDIGLKFNSFNYMLSGPHELESVFDEMQEFRHVNPRTRIAVGSDIGRTPTETVTYMSDLVNMAKDIAQKRGWSFVPVPRYSMRSHYVVRIDGMLIDITKWPDRFTLDLEDAKLETWCDLVPGKPVSPLVHQIILRDLQVTKGVTLLDIVPKKYRRIYND